MRVTEKEILEVLKDIEKGKLKLKSIDNQLKIYSGNLVYNITNGWQITIYKDANNWDYIDSIKTHYGEKIDFEKLDSLPQIKNYCPPKEVCFNIYEMGFEKD